MGLSRTLTHRKPRVWSNAPRAAASTFSTSSTTINAILSARLPGEVAAPRHFLSVIVGCAYHARLCGVAEQGEGEGATITVSFPLINDTCRSSWRW